MIIVPALKTDIEPSEYLRGRTVDAVDFGVKIEELNRIYARNLGQSAGRIFSPAAWTTDSTSFVVDPISSSTDSLKTWTGLIFLEREGVNEEVGLRFIGFGSGITVRAICTRINNDGTLNNFTGEFTSGATDDWFGGVIGFSNASRRSHSSSANPPAPFALTIQAKATSSSAIGRLESFMFFEEVLTAGTMP